MRTTRMPGVRFGAPFWLRIAIGLILIVSAAPWGRPAPAALAGSPPAPLAPAPLPAEQGAAFPPEALAAGTTFCQGSGGDWGTSSSNFSVISACTLTLPTTSTVFLKASASVSFNGAAYEAQFAFGLNGTEVAHPRRWVDVAGDSGDGADVSVALSRMLLLPPGIHTLGLFGVLSSGTGPAQALSPSFSAVVVPDRAGWAGCSSPSLNTWSTSATTLETVTSCTLTVATTSTVYLDSNASAAVATAGASYEGAFQLSVDGSDLIAPQRRLNIATNGGDGTDKSLVLSRLVTVGPGAHTFGLRARIRSGSGPLRLYFPTVSALALPNQPGVPRCSSVGGDWSTAAASYGT
ncbi:MAG TPA: hypothetical protein VD886_22055, partial [Herpetosiphonaceae bacterium]|nr:hypothetical protein [Herpetosiphonaceae bacterium]